jgi:hypothetical protein
MRTNLLLLGAACMGLAACTVAEPGPFPPRPHVHVPKEVTSIPAERLVGIWNCRELNPFPDQAPVLTRLELAPDGRLKSEQMILIEGEAPREVDLVFVLEGRWQVDGDRIVASDVQGSARAALGGKADEAPSSMDGVLDAFARQAEEAPLEIFRLSTDEVVMRENDPGAPFITCARVPD